MMESKKSYMRTFSTDKDRVTSESVGDEAVNSWNMSRLFNSTRNLKPTEKSYIEDEHWKSSFTRLSQSITGSLRIKKKRQDGSGKCSETSTSVLTAHPGGYFDELNRSVACLNHSVRGSMGSENFDSSSVIKSKPKTGLFSRRGFHRKLQREAGGREDSNKSSHISETKELQELEVMRGKREAPPQDYEAKASKHRRLSGYVLDATRPEPEGSEDISRNSSVNVTPKMEESGLTTNSGASYSHRFQRLTVKDRPRSEAFSSDRLYETHIGGFRPPPSSLTHLFSRSSRDRRSCVDASICARSEDVTFCVSDAGTGRVDRLNQTVVPGVSHHWQAETRSSRVFGRNYWRLQGSLNTTFTSGSSLAVGEDPSVANSSHKLITASSVNNIACQTGDQGYADKTGRVASWAVNFEKLLKDAVGIRIFTEFLKKEFSEENIIFWKACEQYRQLSDDQQRKAEAKDIYSRYLSAKASDPVNVDSAARSYTEKFLDNPTAIMFDVAQQQIFQLMRQDSYARFLKSDLYKNKLMAEMEGQPLIPAPQVEQQSEDKVDRKKGKGKENEDKRRRSILPWKQNRKSIKSSSDPDVKKSNKKGKESKDKESSSSNSSNQPPLNVSISSVSTSTNTVTNTNNSNVNNNNSNNGSVKKAPGPGIDLSTMRKEVFHPKERRDAPESNFKFCRIVMPDGSTTVVCAKPGQTSRSVLGKLCEKRSISIASVDVFLLGSDRPLDLNDDISTLGSKEIVIERRVLFRLDLPNGKSIGVKAKPNRSIRDVFKPILNKYGYRMDNIVVHLVGSQECIDLDVAVSELDNQRAVIITDIEMTDLARQDMPTMSSRPARALTGSRAKGGNSVGAGGGSLEEITNKIFEDLMRGKSQLAHGFDELGVLELDKTKAPKGEEARSLGLFGLLRRESWAAKDNHKSSKLKGKVTFALPRNDSKKKSSLKEGEKLFEMLSSAQRLRLEEQRGVQISATDMPSFLCEDKQEVGLEERVAVEEIHHDSKDNVHMTAGNMFDDVTEISKAGFLEKKSLKRDVSDYPVTPRFSASTPRVAARSDLLTTPMSEKWKSHGDRSFSREGVIPSPRVAEAYFRMSPVVVDAKSNGISQSLDEPFKPYYDPPVTQSYQEYLDNGHRNRPDPNARISPPFGNHAFRPLYQSGNENQAPVVSPEKFSPESKKLRCSPEMRNSVGLNSVLPNKLSLTGRSSSASSNVSSGKSYGESPTPRPSSTTSGSPQPHPPSPTRNTNRMSDGMLLHKLQQAKRDRNGVMSGVVVSQADLNIRDYGHSTEQGQYYNMTGVNQRAVANFGSGKHTHSPTQSNFGALQEQDLAQRALLSPRFDRSPDSKVQAPNRRNSPHADIDRARRALLSPRFNSSPRHRPVDPPPYHRRDSPFVHAFSDITYETLVPTRSSGIQANENTSVLAPGHQVTLPSNQALVMSPRHDMISAPGAVTSQWSASRQSAPYPGGRLPRYTQAFQKPEVEQETVTFV